MKKTKVHTVILSLVFAEQNHAWLKRFVHYTEDKNICFFCCHDIQEYHAGMLKFSGVWVPANGEKEEILLPSFSVVGVHLEQSHKNPLGFCHQEGSHE